MRIHNPFCAKRVLIALALFSLLPVPSASLFAAGDDTPLEKPRFALLIGVEKYPNLGPGEQLDGSANDVAAMRQLLIERFDFNEQQITTLIDEQASSDGIRKAMRALIEKVSKLPDDGSPAQVVVHFSGHGSQIPDQASGPDHDEDDGLDETWVPYDATAQGGNEDIRDDEINSLVHEICADGKAQLLIVFDCCHSGSGARGTTKTRQLQRDVTPTESSAEALISRKRLPENAVFLSACRAREEEPEFQEGDKTYGLLTRFLVQTLSEERVVSNLSYDLLQKAIVAGYQRDRRVMQAPVPQLEGEPSTLQKTVLGFGADIDRPPYYVAERKSSSLVRLRAGKFHNVTVGSLYELFEQPQQIAVAADDGNSSLAWLRISKVDGTTSEAQVIRWEDGEGTMPIEGQLPETFKKGFAILRHQEPGDVGLRIKVVRVTGEGSDSAPLAAGDSELPKVISDSLGSANQPGETQWVQWVTEPDQACDLVLRMDGNFASLFPATGMAEVVEPAAKTRGDIPSSLRGGWGPIDLRTGKDSNHPKPQSLTDYLRRITKARNLLSLVQSGTGRSASDYDVKLELMDVRTDDDYRITSQIPWTMDKEEDGALENEFTVKEKEKYALRVTNGGSKAVYVTVLAISSGMGIEVVMPVDELVKLESGKTVTSDAFECQSPHGINQALLLVTREPADFSFVAQDDLKTARGGPLSGGAGSLKDQLVEVAFFQPPQTRGGRRLRRKKADTSWHAEVLSWRSISSKDGAAAGSALNTRGGGRSVANNVNSAIAESAQTTAETKVPTLEGEESDKGYQAIKVFYATDRKPIKEKDALGWPLVSIGALALTLLFVLFAYVGSRHKLWATMAVAAGCATLWFGTNEVLARYRKVKAFERTGIQYGHEQGKLQVGTCEVSIPIYHKIGKLEAPSILRLELNENPEKHVVLTKIEPQEEDDFYSQLRNVVQASSREEVFVFVHGFNVSFEDAARRTGQMTYDLKFEGAPIFYSWPSQASLLHYTVDENNIIWTVPHLKKFLMDVAEKSDAKAVNLIAHSMGNRALTGALRDISLELRVNKRLFNQVILAAPDVDAEVFKEQIAPAMGKIAGHVTLYASSNDNALKASMMLHQNPRAGESGDNIVLVDGVDTIDVSAIDTSLLGHSYYGDSDSIISDMFELLRKAEPAGNRPWLHEQLRSGLRFWVFQVNKGND